MCTRLYIDSCLVRWCVRFSLALVTFIWRTAAGQRCTCTNTTTTTTTKCETVKLHTKFTFVSFFSPWLTGWLAAGEFLFVRIRCTNTIYIFFICPAAAIWTFFRISRRCSRCHFVLSLAATFPLNVYFILQYCVCTSSPLLGARTKQSEVDACTVLLYEGVLGK